MRRITVNQSLNLPVRIFVSLIAVLFYFGLQGQIVDDSTVLVYGPKTTEYTTEYNILNNLDDYRAVDTTIYLFERQSIVDKSGRRYQNLGSFGTALFPVFYTPSSVIGSSSGYTAYNPYAFKPEGRKYYDTKSPYIELFVDLGGGNRNIVGMTFSRNVNPNWNFGFDYKRITTDKQLARNGAGDRQVVGSTFAGFTHYKHGKIPYQALFNISATNHDAVELGGVRYRPPDSLLVDLFEFPNALLRLSDATTNSKERRFHLYHDYQIAEQFQLYHKLDFRKEENTFKDFRGGSTSNWDAWTDYYTNFFIDEDSTYQRATFKSFENEAGIKGDLSSIFYRAYLKVRSVDFFYNYLDPGNELVEKYIGGFARFKWRDKFSVLGEGEYLADGGLYSLKGSLSSDLINLSYRTSKSRVPFIYQRYFGNNHEWSNDFEPVFTNILEGNVNLKYKGIEFVPTVNLTSHQNFLYFDQNRQPQQVTTPTLVSNLGGHINVRFLNQKGEGWHLENEVISTQVTGDNTNQFRIPSLFYNGRFYWSGNWFGDKVPIQVGIDAHARSSYFANSFAPEIQQFHLQDEFEIPGYYWGDAFVNMRLDKFFFSFKWTHINQPADSGYFASPYFPGQPRVIDLIVRWMFFD